VFGPKGFKQTVRTQLQPNPIVNSWLRDHSGQIGSVAPLKSLYFHWTAICSSYILFTPRSLFLLFVLLFSGLIVEDRATAATSPGQMQDACAVPAIILQKKIQTSVESFTLTPKLNAISENSSFFTLNMCSE